MNEVLQLWGHVFNYDEDFLRKTWLNCDFVNIERKPYGYSDKAELNCLEQHSQTSWFQNGFTLIMETQKPLDFNIATNISNTKDK